MVRTIPGSKTKVSAIDRTRFSQFSDGTKPAQRIAVSRSNAGYFPGPKVPTIAPRGRGEAVIPPALAQAFPVLASARKVCRANASAHLHRYAVCITTGGRQRRHRRDAD
jgi:hypothetical protein